jgi:Protein of unknown function (DUF2971)
MQLEEELNKKFEVIFNDINPADFSTQKPLLAHYCRFEVLESILRTKQLWFSNPLFMNDIEEVKFGINEGTNAFLSSTELSRACGSQERFENLRHAINHYYMVFEKDHVLDTYIFCLSKHIKGNNDGLLSMWRGYGDNGKGAAIIFDTAKIEPRPSSPLILSEIHYATADERKFWINNKISEVANLIRNNNLDDGQLHVAAYNYFERLKLFALFTKHKGFDEECEWRIAYLPDRDTDKLLEPMLSYSVTGSGVEPKLKFNLRHLEGVTASDISLEKLVDSIILGPSASSPLTLAVVKKMLDQLKLSELKDRLVSSNIPLRAY